MQKFIFLSALTILGLTSIAQSSQPNHSAQSAQSSQSTQSAQSSLQIVLIRHAEKPAKGYNLTCQGLNRSLQLPNVITKKFGIPTACYIPTPGTGDTTKHARMFQTITPLAAQYNLILNSKYQEEDSIGIAAELRQQHGTVLLVWEHKRLVSIVHALGIQDDRLHWSDDDYDSIWIITFEGSKAILKKDHEDLKPSTSCPS